MVNTKVATFEEAWTHIMRCKRAKEWALNSEPPTAMELLRACENKAYTLSFLGNVDNESPLHEELSNSNHHRLYFKVQTLENGTNLALMLPSQGVHPHLPVFASYAECFREARTTVVRFISGAVDCRLYGMEFVWSVSGALLVSFYEMFAF